MTITISRDRIITIGLVLIIIVFGGAFIYIQFIDSPDNEPTVPDLTVEVEPYDLRLNLPEGWAYNRLVRVDGGFGFGSPDYEGISYLRVNQGATVGVMGDWDSFDDAGQVMEVLFANNWSEPTSITALGYDATYSFGTTREGQGLGVIHVEFGTEEAPQQYIFVGTVADFWENWEETFLAIISTANFREN